MFIRDVHVFDWTQNIKKTNERTDGYGKKDKQAKFTVSSDLRKLKNQSVL